MTAAHRQARAVKAAQALAGRYGIDASEARVLKDSNNTVVHLAPAPLIAKVSTTTIRPDGVAALTSELSIGRHLAGAMAPIAFPAREIPVKVHRLSGHALTLWRFHQQDPDAPADARSAGRALRHFQEALRTYPWPLPSFLVSQLGRAGDSLRDPGVLPLLPSVDRAFLVSEHSRLDASLLQSRLNTQPLHGDPHRGNLLVVDGSCLLIDFEAACTGPVEWDLTALPGGGGGMFPAVDRDLLMELSDLRSLCVAVWCWMQPGRAPEVDEAARFHLNTLRKRARRRAAN